MAEEIAIHANRARAESFGAVAQLYDRARPTYPPALIDALVAGGRPRVLDVGCGTGIAAALLAERGCAVLGVEVDERMAALARGKGIEVEIASFERWNPRGRAFDLVTAGQSWHWVEPRAGSLRAAAALREGGRVGLFWNMGDPPASVRERLDPLYAAFEPALRRRAATSERRARRMRDAIAGLEESRRFEPVAIERFAWRHRYDSAGWVAYLASQSAYQVIAAPRRERLLAAIGAALDELGGAFEVDYETVLVGARRR